MKTLKKNETIRYYAIRSPKGDLINYTITSSINDSWNTIHNSFPLYLQKDRLIQIGYSCVEVQEVKPPNKSLILWSKIIFIFLILGIAILLAI